MWMTVLGLLLGGFVTAWIMEGIKYGKYENNITKKKATLWALAFTIIFTPILYFGLTMMGTPLMMIFYGVIIYLLQKEMNMEFIRPFLKKILKKKVEDKINQL